MEALEVFKITVKEGILIVPFDLKSERASLGPANVINLVACGALLPSVNQRLHYEIVLLPAGR